MSTHHRAGQTTHEAAIYDTDEELVAAAVPFLTEHTTAGDVLVLAADPRTESVLLDRLPDDLGVVRMQGAYERPAATIGQVLDLLHERAAAGAGRVRVVGEVPEDTRRDRWWPWARYEAAANTVYAGYPFSGMCLYDTRTTPAAVLADVHATHPTVVRQGHRQANPAHLDPDTFLSLRVNEVPTPDPLQHAPPALELHNPTPQSGQGGAVTPHRDRSARPRPPGLRDQRGGDQRPPARTTPGHGPGLGSWRRPRGHRPRHRHRNTRPLLRSGQRTRRGSPRRIRALAHPPDVRRRHPVHRQHRLHHQNDCKAPLTDASRPPGRAAPDLAVSSSGSVRIAV